MCFWFSKASVMVCDESSPSDNTQSSVYTCIWSHGGVLTARRTRLALPPARTLSHPACQPPVPARRCASRYATTRPRHGTRVSLLQANPAVGALSATARLVAGVCRRRPRVPHVLCGHASSCAAGPPASLRLASTGSVVGQTDLRRVGHQCGRDALPARTDRRELAACAPDRGR